MTWAAKRRALRARLIAGDYAALDEICTMGLFYPAGPIFVKWDIRPFSLLTAQKLTIVWEQDYDPVDQPTPRLARYRAKLHLRVPEIIGWLA